MQRRVDLIVVAPNDTAPKGQNKQDICSLASWLVVVSVVDVLVVVDSWW